MLARYYAINNHYECNSFSIGTSSHSGLTHYDKSDYADYADSVHQRLVQSGKFLKKKRLAELTRNSTMGILLIEMSEFGNILREKRRARGFSQRRLAEMADIDFSYISKLENGRLQPPSAETIIRFAKILRCTAEELLASANKLPTEIKDSLTGQPAALRFLQEASKLRPTREEWEYMTGELQGLRSDPSGESDSMEKPLDRRTFPLAIDSARKRITPVNPLVGKALTKAEMRVLRSILDGRSNKETACLLHRSTRTIEEHRSHIMRKLGVDNLVDLVKRTAEMGLVELSKNR
jgi:transcriptional regulator with XRE-family HTH domain/DNA-binding CsgD family transcriptional regulator